MLAARGIKPGEVNAYLNPESSPLYSPYLFDDMERAACRIAKAIRSGERVLIYSDYDADGIIGGVVAYNGLKELGANCTLFLPERRKHGYGLNLEVLQRASADGVGLVLSIDCGISDSAEADFLSGAGIDLIIADHHRPPEEPPRAFAVIDAKMEGCGYPYKNLCGAYVGAKVVAAVHDKCGRDGEEFIAKHLPLLALATVADVCPIDGENRGLVARGLAAFHFDAPTGLIRMAQRAGLSTSGISVYHLGFVLGPRINAAGRLESPKTAAALLTGKDENKIAALIAKLEGLNSRRKTMTREYSSAAAQRIKSGECPDPIVVLYDPDWHEGLIGLVAQQLAGEFQRPALIVTGAGSEMCKGSGRTSGRFDLLSALKAAEPCLAGYGGHRAAVGFQIRPDNLSRLNKEINSAAGGKIDKEQFATVLDVYSELGLEDLGYREVEELQHTQPWGLGNEAPTFVVRGLEITRCDTMGDGTHIKLRVAKNGRTMDAIGFGFNRDGIFMSKLMSRADVAAVPEINDFGGAREVRLRLRDINFMQG